MLAAVRQRRDHRADRDPGDLRHSRLPGARRSLTPPAGRLTDQRYLGALPLTAAGLMGQAVDTNATLGNTDLSAAGGFWAGGACRLGWRSAW